MPKAPPFTALIDSLPATVPFVGPEALTRRTGHAVSVRIGANENVFGPSPKAIAAMAEAAGAAWQYGDPENYDLKQALARHLGVGPDNIAIGEGIDGLFGYAVRLFLNPGDTVATSLGAYPTFNYHVAGFGGRLVTTPYVNDHEDPQSLVALARAEGARLLYFANPDNPMATWWDAATVERLIDETPDGCMLMLDEAYGDFAPDGTLPPLDVTREHVLRFRTFSKAYGLAGMRVGYCIGHPRIIAAFDKIRNHFGMTRLSQVAALAALADQDWLGQVKRKVALARQQIYAIASANGLTPLPSAANFVAVDGGRDGAYARAIVDGLLQHGIFVRMPAVAPLSRCVRISAGTEAQLNQLAQALPQVLATLN